MKPENFIKHPWDSVLQGCEYEVIAVNIMKILKRTGNEFRPLSWEEYKKERLKDSDFREREKEYFDKVIPYCTCPEMAKLFSKDWDYSEYLK